MATKTQKHEKNITTLTGLEITTNERKMEKTIISHQTPEKRQGPVRVEHEEITTKTQKHENGLTATKTLKHEKNIKHFRALVISWHTLRPQSAYIHKIFRVFELSWLLYSSQSKKIFHAFALYLILTCSLHAQQWTDLTPEGFTRNDFYQVYFFSPDTGFIMTDDGDLLTMNMGPDQVKNDPVSYSQLVDTADRILNDMYFINRDTGILLSEKNVFKTIDGGNTWNKVSYPDPINAWGLKYAIAEMKLINSTGYICGGRQTFFRSGVIWKTIDGGDTWIKLRDDFDDFFKCILMWSIDTVMMYGANGYYAKTYNGGQNWTTGYDLRGDGWNNHYFSDVQKINDTLAYAGTITGDLMRTTDRGESWEIQYSTSHVYEGVWNIHFLDADTGYFVTDYGVYKTFDGGATIEFMNFYSNGNAIHMFNSQQGVVVARAGSAVRRL